MEQDDAQKRIADLERQIAQARAAGGGPAQGSAMPPPPEGWQQPQPQMGGPGYGRMGRPRSLLRRLWSALLATVALALLLGMFGSAAYNYYAYRTGTPTTATIEKYTKGCVGSHTGLTGILVDTNPVFDLFGVEKCTGTWRVGDTSQSGPIVGMHSIQPAGSALDVRVHNGKAYTATSGKHSLLWMLGIGVPGLVIVVIAWWRRRTGRSSRGLLRGVAEFLDIFSDN